MYYSRLFDDSFNCNGHQFWKYIRARQQNDHTLYVNDQPINNPKDKSDALNNHFISVFTKEDLSKVPNIEDAEVTIPNISPIIFTQSGIQHLLSTLDASKARGPDRVSPYILKYCAEELSPVLQIIFTQSLTTGVLPPNWSSANICPVYKKGSRSSPCNYQPISLTPICSKIMEHIIYVPFYHEPPQLEYRKLWLLSAHGY